MNFSLVIYFCIIFISVVGGKNIRVIGGEDADIREFPYVAQLRLFREKELICAGVIISKRHILTAAHCVDGIKKSDYKIYVGTANSSLYSIPSYKVQSVKIHPGFVAKERHSWKLSNDIAVIMIEPCITLNEFQKVVQLPTEDSQPGDIVIMIGWGLTSYPPDLCSETLQKVSTTVISNYECAYKFPGMIQQDKICVFQNEQIATCHGDSGGPLIGNGELIGISSFARLGVSNDPDVFSRVYFYLDFIRSSMHSWKNLFPCIS